MKSQWLACLALVLGACPSVTVDQNEGVLGPTVEFDPANKVIPFPNNLLLDPTTGKLNLPEQCNESPASAATRVGVLNTLDGFGTYETAINVTFTEAVDVASLAGNVLLLQRATGGELNDPASVLSVPVIPIPGMTQRFTNQTDIKNCTDPVAVHQVTFVPAVPLDQKSTYTVALLRGIKTAGEQEFVPSFTWSLVRQPQPVVEFDENNNVILNRTPLDPSSEADKAQLVGIDLLWNAHHSAIEFLAAAGHDSDDVLLAFEFNTQTVTDPLDPAVEGSPASTPTALPLLGNVSVTNAIPGLAFPRDVNGPFVQCTLSGDDAPVPLDDAVCFLRVLIGKGNYAVGKATCASLGCDNVGNFLISTLLSKQYRKDVDNELYTGTGALPIPGAWDDPLAPSIVHNTDNANPALNDIQAKLQATVLLPDDPPPAAGYPVVIFQHGITRSKNDVFAVMGALTGQGYAVVAIDADNHGTRAVRISNTPNAQIPALDCSDVTVGLPSARPDLGPDPSAKSSCYAPIFSSDLAATRDGFRQSILDIQQLVVSLKACGTTNCGALEVDADQIFYLGQSLGGIYGSMVTGLDPGIKGSVLNVAGVGWVDILENTKQVVAFQCPLVNALIDAGFLSGDKFDPANPTVGLCLTDAWKTDPGYRQFAVIGRWVLDPADPANYTNKLAPTKFLLQRVDGDEVVPNIATDNEGRLIQQLKGDASCGQGSPVPPSTAMIGALGKSLFLDYLTVPASASCQFGNTFSHGSLLAPVGRCSTTTTQTCSITAADAEDGCPGAETCAAGPDGGLATARLQTDAVFFFLNLTETE